MGERIKLTMTWTQSKSTSASTAKPTATLTAAPNPIGMMTATCSWMFMCANTLEKIDRIYFKILQFYEQFLKIKNILKLLKSDLYLLFNYFLKDFLQVHEDFGLSPLFCVPLLYCVLCLALTSAQTHTHTHTQTQNRKSPHTDTQRGQFPITSMK